MRSLSTFACAGETLVGTLDAAPRRTGLLIVSGGNEIRIGAHRGMALLARDIAEAGFPVFRFDRRGIGDSTGANGGFLSSEADIVAAARQFRRLKPQIDRLVAFGNCDAAGALMLFGKAAEVDSLILANPWLEAESGEDALPPVAAIRARYAARLRDPREWIRLISGGVDLKKLIAGVRKAGQGSKTAPGLFDRYVDSLSHHGDVRILLAAGDNSAIAFADAWKRAPAPLRGRIPVARCQTASHSFAREADTIWLREQIRAALDG
ncbi:MAG: hydrolase 1, exosortase A system-associated [Sphingomonas sp.]|nr:hydrolase 1, exosortase A system-associated [Sphingomonas sp.]